MALSGRPIGLAFKLLMVVAMVAGLLVVVPQAQAQGASTPGGSCVNGALQGQLCLDKTASPNPVIVGQPLTFTITATNNTLALLSSQVDDKLPASVDFESASGCSSTPPPGTPDGTVGCALAIHPGGPDTETITVTPRQCGTFTNTATEPNFGLTASTDFTVVGCPTPTTPTTPTQQQPTCPPASIESGIEPQSGNAALSSGADNSGDYAHQVTPSVQTGDSGNMENSTSILQSCGGQSGAIEPGGISKDMTPVVDVSSPLTINQSSSSNN